MMERQVHRGRKKETILVIFGGQSSEHEVSCVSVQTILKSLDPERYEPRIVGITKAGEWIYVPDAAAIADQTWMKGKIRAVLSPDASRKCLYLLKERDTEESKAEETDCEGSTPKAMGEAVPEQKAMTAGELTPIPIDVIFPVLHGKYGEDGTIQGLFELAQIPYVGCGVLASAVSMDKVYTKIIVDTLGIRQARYVVFRREDLKSPELCHSRVEEKLTYPVFVKPSKAGSSCGVSRADSAVELLPALQEAAAFDDKILVEETITGREIECAVLGYGPHTQASDVGEILAAEAFYSYDAKYNNPWSRTEVHPSLPKGKLEEIREKAVKIFCGVDGFGLSRVDFFLEKGTNEVVFNEINTLPGFTAISMYPMLWEEKGLTKTELVTQLIELAKERTL